MGSLGVNVEDIDFDVNANDNASETVEKVDNKKIENKKFTIEQKGGEQTTIVIGNIVDSLKKIKDKAFTITQTIKTKIEEAANNSNKKQKANPLVGSSSTKDGLLLSPTLKYDGTAHATGNWGLKKDENRSLVGELGQETVVRDSKYYTVGDNGAEYVNLKKGDIVFNHRQTEELQKNGHVISGGGRGRLIGGGSFAHGTAFASGGRLRGSNPSSSSSSSSKKKSSSSGKSSSSSKSAEDTKETIDYIEIAISRMERALDKLDQQAGRTYRSWTYRNSALTKEIKKTSAAINLQQKAYNGYMKKAKSVDLSASIKKKVRNGTINIKDYSGDTADKIQEYQKWYRKYASLSGDRWRYSI